MSDIKAARNALIARILEGEGTASRAQRRAAFDNAADGSPWRTLVQKTSLQSYRVTDEDISGARSAGLTEDQIFELWSVLEAITCFRENSVARCAIGHSWDSMRFQLMASKDARAPDDPPSAGVRDRLHSEHALQ